MGLLEIARDFAVANWDNAIMWVIGGILIYLAIKKDMEPTLLLPMGFGAIISEPAGFRNCGGRRNHPHSLRLRHCKRIFPAGAFHRHRCNDRLRPRADQPETYAFRCGGAVRHFFHALHGNPLRVRADGIRFHCDNRRGGRPDKRIVVANHLGISANNPGLFSAIVVAAYSYMALVPIIQRPVIKLITTKHERLIRMEYEQRDVSKLTRILFPIVITFVVGIVAPGGLPLIACLMFGNLLRECGVLNALSETAQKVLANLITLFLGLSIAATMSADKFLRPQTLLVLGAWPCCIRV